MDLKTGKKNAKKYYDQEAQEYKKMYENGYDKYPANAIRLNFIIERLKQNKVKTVLDAGCGTCAPMIRLLKEGFNVTGFDFSQEMVKEGKKELEKAGLDANLIYQGDIENEESFRNEKFDVIIALGVFPHLLNEEKAMLNIRKSLKRNGRTFIEFRNDLFAAYTLNAYSLDFFLNRVINMSSLPPHVAKEVTNFYAKRLMITLPEKKGKERLSKPDILSKFHNPLTIEDSLFQPNGFSVEKIHFYHYHALPPVFEKRHPDLFRKLSISMEKTDDWRGYLMASAFVVEAKINA